MPLGFVLGTGIRPENGRTHLVTRFCGGLLDRIFNHFEAAG